MNQSKLTILFVIKLAKKNKKGYCPLNCLITFNKKRKEFAAGIKTDPDTWNAKLKNAKAYPVWALTTFTASLLANGILIYILIFNF